MGTLSFVKKLYKTDIVYKKCAKVALSNALKYIIIFGVGEGYGCCKEKQGKILHCDNIK